MVSMVALQAIMEITVLYHVYLTTVITADQPTIHQKIMADQPTIHLKITADQPTIHPKITARMVRMVRMVATARTVRTVERMVSTEEIMLIIIQQKIMEEPDVNEDCAKVDHCARLHKYRLDLL
ncbi:MAG: hypothetical protein ACI8RD_007431 [Bacillariaceae sp.]|jgi:hypothetical protein